MPLSQTFSGAGLGGTWHRSAQGQHFHHCRQTLPDDDPRRDSGFTIFYMSINIGSTIGYGICGYLGEKIGWHWGFGAAGIGMLFGVYQYVRYQGLLGDAGAQPNPMSDEARDD